MTTTPRILTRAFAGRFALVDGTGEPAYVTRDGAVAFVLTRQEWGHWIDPEWRVN